MAAEQDPWSARHRRRWAGGLGIFVVGCCMLVAASARAETAGDDPNPLPVEILRGSVATPPVPVEPGAGPDQRRAIAGERLWFVDEAGGRLVGCRLINTIQVGGQAIRCTERPLPKGRPARD